MAAKTTKGTWKPQTEFVTLPSGQCPRIRRIDVISFIMEDGNIPDNVMKLMAEGGDIEKLKGEDWLRFIRIVNETCRRVFVEPRVVDEPDYDNNEIRATDIVFQDKLFLWNYLMGGATDQMQQAARFPEEQSANGGTPPTSEIIREVTE